MNNNRTVAARGLVYRAYGPRAVGGISMLCLAGLASLGGCSHHRDDAVHVHSRAWKSGVEFHWYAPGLAAYEEPSSYERSESTATHADSGATEGESTTVRTWESESMRPVNGEYVSDFSEFVLGAGEYDFEYTMPWRNERIAGEINIRCPDSDRAKEFLRHTPIVIHPGGNLNSLLTEDDLLQVSGGDTVTKVLFVADLRAIDDRVSFLDREIRRMEDIESRYATQQRYWSTKRDERRRNAMAPGDQGWGEDIPALDLAFYQVLVGAERYHWDRYSQADHMTHTYEEHIADLRLPIELLRAERSSLRSILGSVRVLNRAGDMIIATPTMTQRYHDPEYDLSRPRKTLGTSNLKRAFGLENPQHALEFPYFYSYAQGSYLNLIAYPVALPTGTKGAWASSRMSESLRAMGEVVCVMSFGPRGLDRLE